MEDSILNVAAMFAIASLPHLLSYWYLDRKENSFRASLAAFRRRQCAADLQFRIMQEGKK